MILDLNPKESSSNDDLYVLYYLVGKLDLAI